MADAVPAANMLSEVRSWLIWVFVSTVAAWFAWQGWRLSRSAVRAHFDFVIPYLEDRRDKSLFGFVRIENSGRTPFYISRLEALSPPGMRLSLDDHTFSKTAECWFFVDPGDTRELHVFMELPPRNSARVVRISLRVPVNSRLRLYKVYTLTAILPARIKEQTA
jgi:hypothetical protein